jgi:hypothetical protein
MIEPPYTRRSVVCSSFLKCSVNVRAFLFHIHAWLVSRHSSIPQGVMDHSLAV